MVLLFDTRKESISMVYLLTLMVPMQSNERLEPDKEIVHDRRVGVECAIKKLLIFCKASLLHSHPVSFKPFSVELSHG